MAPDIKKVLPSLVEDIDKLVSHVVFIFALFFHSTASYTEYFISVSVFEYITDRNFDVNNTFRISSRTKIRLGTALLSASCWMNMIITHGLIANRMNIGKLDNGVTVDRLLKNNFIY